MKKFWNWTKNEETGERELHLSGGIASESWYEDDVTPKAFRDELLSDTGDVTVWINSPGGDCIAAAQIYTMLMEYKGAVTVKIDGIAASAASVIAMAGGKVLMSPVSMMMIHNPMTGVFGNKDEMTKAMGMLDSVKDSIVNAYEIKTGLTRTKLSHLMDCETWMDARKAEELGFSDGMLRREERGPAAEGVMFSKAEITNSLMDKIAQKCKIEKVIEKEPTGRSVEALKDRLSLIKY